MSDNMINLMELRHRLREIYAEHSFKIQAVLKFLLALTLIIAMDITFGSSNLVTSVPLTIIGALVCCAVPWTGMTFLIGVICLANLHSLGLPIMFMFAALLAVVALTYLVFRPKDAVVLLLIPLLFLFRMTFVIPLIVGLVGTMFSLVSVGYGVIIAFFLNWVCANHSLLSSNSVLTMKQQAVYTITGVMNDPELVIYLVACSATCVFVYVIRRLSVKHSHEIAIAAGSVGWVVLIIICSTVANVPVDIPNLFLEVAVGIIAALAFDFLFFTVDYRSAIITQFEDEDYYYYVKAVPKMDVQPLDYKFKVITSADEEETEPDEE